MTRRFGCLTAASLALGACGEKQEAETGGMPEMAGMGGMAMRSDSLMPMMRAHLDSLAALSPELAADMVAAHDAMASHMLDARGAAMTAMAMKPDPAWTALADSVRRDLAELPGLSGRRTLSARVLAHVGRMHRLLGIHETMMKETSSGT